MTTDELLQRWSDGSITADELRELTAKLAKPEHQSALLDDWLLESSLPDRLPGAAVAGPHESAMNRKIERIAPVRAKQWAGWLSWRPLTAAAAGIVFGMFCTSVVFAYVGPSLGKVLTLLQDSFESGPSPEVKGMPREIGKWSGDFTEIVGEQQGVKPASGKKMLRFLRADYEGKPQAESSQICDLYRLVDVRDYEHEFSDGGAVVQLSAAFNGLPHPHSESYVCKILVYAFDSQTVELMEHDGMPGMAQQALAMARNSHLRMHPSPGTWQRTSAELRLPPKTEFLLLHIAIGPDLLVERPMPFPVHYLDDIKLTLGRRAPLP